MIACLRAPQALWSGQRPWLQAALTPLSGLFRGLVSARRTLYRNGVLRRQRLPVPVVVVGNLTVGGTGKTPLVAAIGEALVRAGHRPGVVMRGYGRRSRGIALVEAGADPDQYGDEAVLLARSVPVAVAAHRPAAGRMLIERAGCDVIISDDGLQHYRLDRDVEIVVVDGRRQFGNGLCLPAGPLREPLSRLSSVDAVVVNGAEALPSAHWTMHLSPGPVINLRDPARTRPLASFRGQEVHGAAGIGDPERFFATLRSAGIRVRGHAFPDHHRFRPRDLEFADDLPVLMTEKDGVKCKCWASERCWVVPVRAHLQPAFEEWLLGRLCVARE